MLSLCACESTYPCFYPLTIFTFYKSGHKIVIVSALNYDLFNSLHGRVQSLVWAPPCFTHTGNFQCETEVTFAALVQELLGLCCFVKCTDCSSTLLFQAAGFHVLDKICCCCVLHYQASIMRCLQWHSQFTDSCKCPLKEVTHQAVDYLTFFG